METIHITISGQVQGVGFRQFVKGHALKHGVLGWVRNTDDGDVEGMFHGDEHAVAALIELCRQGPPLASVTDVAITPQEEQFAFPNFAIVP